MPTRGPFASKIVIALFSLAAGYYIGCQHALIVSLSQSSSSSIDFLSPQLLSPKSLVAPKDLVTSKKELTKDPKTVQLHPQIQLSEDTELFKKTVYPLVRKLLDTKEEVKRCPSADVKPYLDILKNVDENHSYYEDESNYQSCPVVFLFYFEGGTRMVETFFDYYANIKTKRCINFIVNIRYKDDEEANASIKKNGYKVVGAHYPKQDKTISMSLYDMQKEHGDDVLVSVNDLDHLLVWFDTDGKPHRYSSYSDMVMLYAYELLSTEGCSNQNVHEKYVVPCTCLMENNDKYISTIKDGVVWSEYGKTNRFHPTANFYLDRKLETKEEKRDSGYAYSIGTVFANLRAYEGDMITHHKIGWRTKKIFSRAQMCGVIHARSDNMIQTLAKYHHFLMAMDQNVFREKSAPISGAMGCSLAGTHDIIANEATCRQVKEFSNILSIGHQKRACLNAGYSEEHCMIDMSCCLTY
mmetsp:Transcript_11420/g.17029  ORF Transcript_11420/g.17029 Transcript_11420/m.17029 type:complete len:468 (-) Transcript_11420:261-1664(-)